MNTPSAKQLIRVARERKLPKRQYPKGDWHNGILNPAHARLVGQIMTILPHIEERMIAVLARLLGHPGTDNGPARQVFRSIQSEHARIRMMQALLKNGFINREKPQIFDEVIRGFEIVKDKRNTYAHGLWFTHESGKVYLAPLSDDMKQLQSVTRREIGIPELKEDIRRINRLVEKIEEAVAWIDPRPIPPGKIRMHVQLVNKPKHSTPG